MAVLRIEQILHNFEDQKFANFFNLKQINFRVTLVTCILVQAESSLFCYYCRTRDFRNRKFSRISTIGNSHAGTFREFSVSLTKSAPDPFHEHHEIRKSFLHAKSCCSTLLKLRPFLNQDRKKNISLIYSPWTPKYLFTVQSVLSYF